MDQYFNASASARSDHFAKAKGFRYIPGPLAETDSSSA